MIPNKWQSRSPAIPTIIFNIVFFNDEAIPQASTRKVKPIINPPVLPNSAAVPALKPEKTGTPIRPNSMYTIIDTIDFFVRRAYPQSATVKVCIVTGTPDGSGIVSCALTAIKAVSREIMDMSIKYCLLLFILFKIK